MAERFKLNESRFASYKAHKVTKALQNLPVEEFEQNATNLLKTFNRHQLTEYNTLTTRARTAKQFTQFTEDSDLYPCLEWIHTRSDVPRDEHVKLVGLILPIDSPVWQENQPGNLWNCKCDWKQSEGPATSGKKVVNVKPADGLEGNPVTTGELVTDQHPYFNVKDIAPIENFAYNNALKPDVIKYRKDINPFEGKVVDNDNLQTGKMTILRGSVDSIINHNYNFKIRSESLFLENLKNIVYLGWAKSTNAKAAYYLYYKMNVGGKNVFLNMMIHKSYKSEVPYAIIESINLKKVKKGLPDDIGKWTK